MQAIVQKVMIWLAEILAGRLDGNKTYLAAAGLAGLALYQFSQGQYELAIQSVLAAIAAAGVRHAIAKATDTSPPSEQKPTPPQS